MLLTKITDKTFWFSPGELRACIMSDLLCDITWGGDDGCNRCDIIVGSLLLFGNGIMTYDSANKY